MLLHSFYGLIKIKYINSDKRGREMAIIESHSLYIFAVGSPSLHPSPRNSTMNTPSKKN